MVFLEAFLLCLVAVSTRIPFLIAPSSDKATQLWIIDLFAKNRRMSSLVVEDSLQQGRLAYPPLPHALLAFLPSRLRLPGAIIMNVGFDVLHVMIVYGVLSSLLPKNENDPLSYSFFFALLFATLPILHPVNARLVGIGARTLAPLLITLYVMSIVAADSISWSFYLCAIALSAMVVLTSQFGLQALIVFSIGVSAASLSVIPVLIIAISILILLILPGIDVGGQLRVKLNHYAWYFGSINNHIEIRNNLKHMSKIISERRRGALPRILIYSLTSLTPVIVIIGIGSALLLLLASAAEVGGWPSGQLIDASSSVLAASLISCVVTMAGPMRVLGEAERYVEYAAPFLIFVAGSAATMASFPKEYIWLATLLNLCGVSLHWAVMFAGDLRRSFLFEPEKELGELAGFLDQKPRRRIVASPIFLASALALLTTEKHKFLHVLIVDKDGIFSHWRDDMIGYPHMRGDAKRYIQKYEADIFVSTRESISKINEVDVFVDLSTMPILFENDIYVVFDLRERNLLT